MVNIILQCIFRLEVVLHWFFKTLNSPSACGESHYTGPSGTVTSPNFPNDYASNLNCKYHIRVPAGKVRNHHRSGLTMGNRTNEYALLTSPEHHGVSKHRHSNVWSKACSGKQNKTVNKTSKLSIAGLLWGEFIGHRWISLTKGQWF